jgi:hypothetical protein
MRFTNQPAASAAGAFACASMDRQVAQGFRQSHALAPARVVGVHRVGEQEIEHLGGSFRGLVSIAAVLFAFRALQTLPSPGRIGFMNVACQSK